MPAVLPNQLQVGAEVHTSAKRCARGNLFNVPRSSTHEQEKGSPAPSSPALQNQARARRRRLGPNVASR